LSSSDDSYWESIIEDDNVEDILLMVAMNNLHGEASQKRKRRGSTVGWLCIARNCVMCNKILMND
jgi:hypothetical protein